MLEMSALNSFRGQFILSTQFTILPNYLVYLPTDSFIRNLPPLVYVEF